MNNVTPYLPGFQLDPDAVRAFIAEGESLKQTALQLFEQQRALYVLRGRRALLTTLLSGAETATADDVRAAVTLPPSIDPKCFGSVPGLLRRLGIISEAGYATTKRAAAHARPTRLWRLADADAARSWLAANPDRDEPEHGAAAGGGE